MSKDKPTNPTGRDFDARVKQERAAGKPIAEALRAASDAAYAQREQVADATYRQQ
jgi:hypothetical protein